MLQWGNHIVAGSLVIIHAEGTLGLVLSRDEEHIYLWNVLVEGKVFSIHSSRLRVAM
jgi:hypothetical protein